MEAIRPRVIRSPDAGAFMGSIAIYSSSKSCLMVIWQSRRILWRRPGPMVSPECAGTTVLRPSWWRRTGGGGNEATSDPQDAETGFRKCSNDLGAGDARSPAHAAMVMRWIPMNSNSRSSATSRGPAARPNRVNWDSLPTVLRKVPYRFFFYSADRDEPAHGHVERDRRTRNSGWTPSGSRGVAASGEPRFNG